MITIINNKFQNVKWPKDIDLVVTSPPYKDEDGFSRELIDNFQKFCYENMSRDSLLFLNFGHLAGFKSRPFEVAMMLEMDFELVDTITWVKNHYRPIQGKRRVNNLTEFIFMFSKGNPKIDRLSIGIPYADKSNIKRWKGTEGKDLKCQGNVWHIDYETVNKEEEKLHNDRFPLDLPKNCIKLSGIPKGSLVVDPFSGSGTTAKACEMLGMNFWGTEIDSDHYKTSLARLKL